MNDQNPEQPSSNPAPAAPQPLDTKRRLRELLTIPERDRTDDQWDEIIELEIQLAPGNRISSSDQGGGGNPAGAKSPGQGKKHRPRGNNNRRSRSNKPAGGSAGGQG